MFMRTSTFSARVVAKTSALLLCMLLIALSSGVAHAQPESAVLVPPAPPENPVMLENGLAGIGITLQKNLDELQNNLATLAALNTPQNQAALNSLGANYGNAPALGSDIGKAVASVNLSQFSGDASGFGQNINHLITYNLDRPQTPGSPQTQQRPDKPNAADLATLRSAHLMENADRMNQAVSVLNSDIVSLTRTYGNLVSLSSQPPTTLLAMPDLTPTLKTLGIVAGKDLQNLSKVGTSFQTLHDDFKELSKAGDVQPGVVPDHKVAGLIANIGQSMEGLTSDMSGMNDQLTFTLTGGHPEVTVNTDDSRLSPQIRKLVESTREKALKADAESAGEESHPSSATAGTRNGASPGGWNVNGDSGSSAGSGGSGGNGNSAVTGSGSGGVSGGAAPGGWNVNGDSGSNAGSGGSGGNGKTVTGGGNGGVAPGGWNVNGYSGSSGGSGGSGGGGGGSGGASPGPATGPKSSIVPLKPLALETMVASFTPASYGAWASVLTGPAGDENPVAASRAFTGIPLMAKPAPAEGSVMVAFDSTGLCAGASCGVCPVQSLPPYICTPIAGPAKYGLDWTSLAPVVPCQTGYFNPPNLAAGVVAVKPNRLLFNENCGDERYKNIKIVGPQKVISNASLNGAGPIVPAKTLGVANPLITSADQQNELLIDTTIGDTLAFKNSDGTQGAMPNKADRPNGMRHKDTEAIPLVNNYAWLWKENDGDQVILYRGTGNNTEAYIENTITQQAADSGLEATEDDMATTQGNDADIDVSYIRANKQCGLVAHDCPQPPAYGQYQYWIRLVRDACTNQYLLPMSLNPTFVFTDVWRNDQYPWNESICQPLILTPLTCMPDLYNHSAGGTWDNTCLQDKGESDADVYAQSDSGGGKNDMYDYRAWGYLEWAYLQVLESKYSPIPAGTNPNGPIPVSNAAAGMGTSASAHITPPDNGGSNYTLYGQDTTGGGNSPSTPPGFYIPGKGNSACNQGTDNSSSGCDCNGPGCPADATKGTFTGNLTTINQLAPRNYERIWDTTNPFTPRWDVKGGLTNPTVDRSYSSKTLFLAGGAVPIPDTGYTFIPPGTGLCNVRCAVVPVDILNFRYAEFNSCMTCRINQNTHCFWQEYWANFDDLTDRLDPLECAFGNACPCFDTSGNNLCFTAPNRLCTVSGPLAWAEAFLNVQTGTSPTCTEHAGAFAVVQGSNCKSTLQTAGYWPPCSTEFDDPYDASTTNGVKTEYTCEGLSTNNKDDCLKDANDYPDSAQHPSTVSKCCDDLAQAVAPINTLKIRSTKDWPQLADDNGNLAEGYKFSDYFPSGHMPYMRWWDTGYAARGNTKPDIPIPLGAYTIHTGIPSTAWPSDYDPFCWWGQYDAIVGVGTEDDSGGGNNQGLCRYGGSQGNGYLCMTESQPDALTSWFELKQYQSNAIRTFGMNCLPMHEKMWKWVGAEEGGLFLSGKHFDTEVPRVNDPTGTLGELKANRWPLRWRGYLSDSHTTTGCGTPQFGQFPGWDIDASHGCPSAITGLDNAQSGDIIYVLPSDTLAATGGLMPFIAVVGYANHPANTSSGCSGNTECSDSNAICSSFVDITDVNNGKYPDVCGNTDYAGMGQTRTIFREWLPTVDQDVIFGGGVSAVTNTDTCGDSHVVLPGNPKSPVNFSAGVSCIDPKMQTCLLDASGHSNWDAIHIYRPTLDERGTSR
jgi:hypothetical protein